MEYGKLLKEQFPEDVIQFKVEYGEETVTIAREAVRKVLRFLKEDPRCEMNMLSDLTAVDHLAERRSERFEIIYQLYSLKSKQRLRIKTNLSEKVKADSISDLWPIADWLEREVWDMFGISFEGRSDIKRLFMYEEFVGHPLRKDYDIRKRQPLLGPKN